MICSSLILRKFRLMATSLALLIFVMLSHSLHAQGTATYDIPLSDIYVITPTPANTFGGTLIYPSALCNATGTELQFNNVGSSNNDPNKGLTFRWQSIGIGYPTAISFEFYTEYVDLYNFGPFGWWLNGGTIAQAGISYPPSDVNCNDAISTLNWATGQGNTLDFYLNPSTGGYVVGGQNTLTIQSTPIRDWVLAQNPAWNNAYIRVTVTYATGVNNGDYAISTTGGDLVVSDLSGNSDVLEVTQTTAGSNLNFNAAGRTYTLNGGPVMNFPVDISLTGINSVEINAGNGNDTIQFGDPGSGNTITNMPSLTINGDDGDDRVYAIGGSISFLQDADLDVDMTNDASPGDVDEVDFQPVWTNIISVWVLSGSGNATIKVSKSVELGVRSAISTQDGDLLVEANWNGNTAGNFSGVTVDNLSFMGISNGGSGQLTVRGKGGDTGTGNHGVLVSGGDLVGGTTGTTLVEGVGGPSTSNTNHGVNVVNLSALLTSQGSHVTVTGIGGGSAGARDCSGVFIGSSGVISSGGTGNIMITGVGGPGTDVLNFGVAMVNTGTVGSLTSGGDVVITGTVGPNTSSEEDVVARNVLGRQNITINASIGGVIGNQSVPTASPRNVSATQTSTFGAGSKFNYYVGGSTQAGASANRYYPWYVEGLIDLNGAELNPTGNTFTPTATQDYEVLFNDGTDPVQGRFTYMGNVLNEGDQVLNFRGSSDVFYITYQGGDGNDIILLSSPVVPTALCNSVTVQLDNRGMASVSPSDLDNGSTYPSGLQSITVDPMTFGCADVGAQTAVLTITDVNNNTATCAANVLVQAAVTSPPLVAEMYYLSAKTKGTEPSLYSVNPATGAATLIGATGVTLPNYISNGAFLVGEDHTGNLFMSTLSSQFYSVNKSTGQASLIGNIDIYNGSGQFVTDLKFIEGITYNPTDQKIYASANTVANLGTPMIITIDPSNARATLVTNISGTNVDNDKLFWWNGVMYSIDYPNIYSFDASFNRSLIGSIPSGFNFGGGLTQDDAGKLYATGGTANQDLVEVTSLTGPVAYTTIGSLGLASNETNGELVFMSSGCRPEAICQDITVALDANGTASISIADIDNGSEICGGCTGSLSLSQDIFGCSDMGANTVTLTAEDGSGNNSTCTATVTVDDYVEPAIEMYYMSLGNSSTAKLYTINPATGASTLIGSTGVNIPGSGFFKAAMLVGEDHTGKLYFSTFTGHFYAVDKSTGQASLVGNIDIYDGSGQLTHDLKFVEGISYNPVDQKIYASASTATNMGSSLIITIDPATGHATLVKDLGSTADNDRIFWWNGVLYSFDFPKIYSFDASFNRTQIGTNQFGADLGGGMAQDDAGKLYATGTSGNTGLVEITSLTGSISYTSVGSLGLPNSNETNGEMAILNPPASAICVQQAICKNAAIRIDANGTAALSPEDINDGSQVCGGCNGSMSLSQDLFDCSEIGANTVTLTVDDGSGNTSNCTATVTVGDFSPVAQMYYLSLGNSSQAKLYTVNTTTGAASLIGSTGVNIPGGGFFKAAILVGEDHTGNLYFSTFTGHFYAVDKATGLASLIGNIDIYDGSGQLTHDLKFVEGISYNPADQKIYASASTATNMGSNLIITIDPSNARATLVKDLGSTADNDRLFWWNGVLYSFDFPNIYSFDASFNRSAVGTNPFGANLGGGLAQDDTGKLYATGTSANSGLVEITSLSGPFAYSSIGSLGLPSSETNGELAFLSSSNPSTCTQAAVCQSITVDLDAAGSATITAQEVDNGSQTCGGCAGLLSLSKTQFDCSNIGPNTVTLTVGDGLGTTTTCTASVTIQDVTGPGMSCKSHTVQLDASGNGSLSPSDLDNGSADACGIQGLASSKTSFDCGDQGANSVTLTATDVNGNTSDCIATVTVEDKIAPVITLNGDNPQKVCQGDAYTEAGATASDNCAVSAAVIPSGTVDVNTPASYTITYTVTDDAGNTASASRTVNVVALPAALVQDNCPNNNPTCGQIRLNVCPFQYAPDLGAHAMSNAAYISGASLSWYAFSGANNPAGSQLSGPPVIDMDAPATTTNAWVTQTVNGCESAPTQMRVRVKPNKDPNLALNFSGISLPTCGGAKINILPAVSGASNKVIGYRFYKGKPNQGGTLLTSTLGMTVANVNDPYFYVPVANGTNTYYVQSIMSNGNQCGGEASDDLTLPFMTPQIASVTTTINGVAGPTFTTSGATLTIDAGDVVTFTYTGINITNVTFFSLGNFSVVTGITSNSITFRGRNNGTTVIGGNTRTYTYNGPCAGEYFDIGLFVNPCLNCRSTNENLTQLSLAAQQLNANDVALNWDVNFDQELAGFEIEREITDEIFEAIGYQDFTGTSSYKYIDRNGISELSRYRIKLIFANGGQLYSETVEVKTDKLKDLIRFTVYPNPTTDLVQVKALFPIVETFNWQLTDMVGKTLMHGDMQAEEMSLDLSRLPAGVYQLVTTSPQGIRSVNRIVKK